jgi:hypothetical protein
MKKWAVAFFERRNERVLVSYSRAKKIGRQQPAALVGRLCTTADIGVGATKAY